MSRFKQESVVTAFSLGLLVLASGCDMGRVRNAKFDTTPDVAAQIRAGVNVESSGGSAASTAEATGFATIRGVFKVNGTPPEMARLTVSGDDTSVCAPGGAAPLAEDVVAGPNGELANVLIFLETKIPDNWIHADYEATRDATLTGEAGFDQKACIFLSHVFAMRSTQKVEIINSDPVGHNTNIQPTKGAITSNNSLPANSTTLYAPGGESPLPFAVTCSIHPWMKAYMITRDSPYFAVTKKDGSFEIKNVPAGVPLTFRIWQEKSGFVQEVTVNDAATKWSKGRYKVTLTDGEDVDLNVGVPAAALQ